MKGDTSVLLVIKGLIYACVFQFWRQHGAHLEHECRRPLLHGCRLLLLPPLLHPRQQPPQPAGAAALHPEGRGRSAQQQRCHLPGLERE